MKVTTLLFDAGLADPRGGQYREIELNAPTANSDDHVQTHGWVFHDQYAVCWNGSVYRVFTVGPMVDLDRDVRMVAGAQPWSGLIRVWTERPPARVSFWFQMEGPGTLAPVSIALLLRLGRPHLARLLWQAPESNDVFGAPGRRDEDSLQLLGTALEAWFGTAYWRLIEARSREDDQEAVDIAESLTLWEKRVLESWKPIGESNQRQASGISGLTPVPLFLADSQRRLREPARAKINPRSLAENGGHSGRDSSALVKKPQAERIADLIERLEDVRGYKITIPGQLVYSFDPICELLTKEGKAAVEPLLDAYEHDERLTRTVDYGQPSSLERTPVPVSVVAKSILSDILHIPQFIKGTTPAELRAWWGRREGNDQLLRSFEQLADDRATPEQWLESADVITLRSDVHRSGAMTSVEPGACSPDKPAPAAFGESLRAHQNLSVNELLVRRVSLLALSGPPEAACRMAFLAYRWEAKASLPALHIVANLEACRSDSLVAMARMSLGEPHAAAEWATGLRKRISSPAFLTAELAPIWMFPDDAAMEQTADWLFKQPNAPLAPGVEFHEINSPLLTVRSYRLAVQAALNDSSVAATARRSADGLLWLDIRTRGWGSNEPGTDPRQAPPGEVRPVRVKDMVAWELSGLKGAPAFQPDWPVPEKDASIADLVVFLRRHENELRAFPAKPEDTACSDEYVYLGQ